MKYALIGCGRIAVNHIKAALNNELEIVAVCDGRTYGWVREYIKEDWGVVP